MAMLVMNNESIAIVCAADDRYVIPLAVTVRSLLLSNQSNNIVLFVIDGGIKESDKHKILSMLRTDKVDLKIEWIKPDLTRLVNMKVSGHVSLAAYYRLLIPDLLPNSVNKVIYLDCDLIVNTDLRPLWEMDMGENYILAAPDTFVTYVSSLGGLEDYNKLGIPANNKYFNSGVMVINLEKWRSENISATIIEYLDKNQEFILLWDQEGLNAVLSNKWGEIEPKWNHLVAQEDICDDLINNVYIIHFASHIKPWHFSYQYPTKDLFFQYLDMTPWSTWKPTDEGIEQEINQKTVRHGLPLLFRRIGAISPDLQERIQQLSLAQLANSGRALLGLSSAEDIENWLHHVLVESEQSK